MHTNSPPIPEQDHITGRGVAAVIRNRHGEVLMHLRDDVPGVHWPGYWSVLGGGMEPGEDATTAILRELDEEAELGGQITHLQELFALHDPQGSGHLITFFSAAWDGDAAQLPLTEGVELRFFAPHLLEDLRVPPFILDGIGRATR